MKAKRKQSVGLTLPEVVTATAIIAMLLGLAIPSIRAINSSFQSTGAKNIISGALACARASAAQHQRYAGIRFQFDQYGDQYIIPIIQEPDVGAFAFCAILGRKPMELPKNLAVTDLRIVAERKPKNPASPSLEHWLDGDTLTDADKDLLLADDTNLTDITTFSIICSPSGRLVIHGVQVKRRISTDTVFNKEEDDPADEVGMFYEDTYYSTDNNLGLGPEPSRSSFVIYDKKIFENVHPDYRWSGYLKSLKPVYINPYTGTIIE